MFLHHDEFLLFLFSLCCNTDSEAPFPPSRKTKDSFPNERDSCSELQ